LDYAEVRMHGVVARRRVAHFGWSYGYESWKIAPGAEILEGLLPVRVRLAGFVGVEAEGLAEALVTEYPAGAGIGWHRDAPAFGIVAAVSLGSSCRLRFRRGKVGAWETAEAVLAARSAYAITGEARSGWQHGIPEGRERRWSITYRTLRRARGTLPPG
jgi:alkylated DNA repair protein (DNA oxidative demethylase)